MKIAIYKTSLKSTGRVVYVGQTKKVNDVGTKYFGSRIHKSFNVCYVREHFVSEIITITEDQNEANYLERYYIDYYCTLEEYGGFNIAHGGLGSPRYGEKNPSYGKTNSNIQHWHDNMSEDAHAKWVESLKGPRPSMKGEKHPMAKKCIYNNIEFGSKKEAYNYAKDYCGYKYSYNKFRNQFK